MPHSVPTAKQHVAVLQMNGTDDVTRNVETVRNRLEELEKSNPDVVCLPENSLYLRIDRERTKPQPLTLTESFWQDFSAWAKRTKTHILFGSVARTGPSKMKNTTIYVSSSGEVKPVYEKIHLFDVDVEGAPPSRESDNYDHGDKPVILDIDGWKWGLSICYDLRFSELYKRYALEGAHVISVPAAFLVPTGRAHWHVLLRARAIECQAFVVAAAQSGGHQAIQSAAKRDTYGHSLIIGPWGEILAERTESGEGLISYIMDPATISRARRQIPMAGHRRLE